jgi:hypothetical protein
MEEQATFGTFEYELLSYLEKVQSQFPALHLLMQLGWQYLTPEETVRPPGRTVGRYNPGADPGRSHLRIMMWCNAPAASIPAFRGIPI